MKRTNADRKRRKNKCKHNPRTPYDNQPDVLLAMSSMKIFQCLLDIKKKNIDNMYNPREENE